MLRRELLVEVAHDHIVVRVTGTSYAISYYKDRKLDWPHRPEPAGKG